MSKLLILSGILAAGASVMAITEYVSPASPSNPAVPAIHVDLSATTVMRTLETLTAEKYFAHMSGEIGVKPADLHFTTQRQSNHAVQYTIKFGDEMIAEINANINEIGPVRSEVGIVVTFHSSKFAKHPSLHPFDVKAMESIFDLAITDYVNSILKSQRMASKEELDVEITRRLGFSKEQAIGLNNRIEKAMYESYRGNITAASDAYNESGDEGQGDYIDHEFISGNPMVNPQGIEIQNSAGNTNWSYPDGSAQEAAAEAAAKAGDAAARAGDAAAAMTRAAARGAEDAAR